MRVLSPSDDLVVESVRFPAGPYSLEGELIYSEGTTPSGAVVVAGPHPLLGGTMQNNVVRRLTDGLASRGRVCLRFNYRGVGGSTGPALDTIQQLSEFWASSRLSNEEALGEDLCGAAAFVRRVVGVGMPLALAGYSFGCTLLPAAAHAEQLAPLVLIAPTVGMHDLGAFTSLHRSMLVIAPAGDFATREEEVSDWLGRLDVGTECLRPSLDGHFFRGHESWLTDAVAAFLDRRER
jgi:alpha/beta superfamily hydrolase